MGAIKMKITKSQMMRIIKEELSKLLKEAFEDIPTWEGYPIELVRENGYGEWKDIIEQAKNAGIENHPLVDEAKRLIAAEDAKSAERKAVYAAADPCTSELLPGEDEWDREQRMYRNDCHGGRAVSDVSK